MSTPANSPRRHSPHFFRREADGTVRLRIRFENSEASLYEKAAGRTPVMEWIHRTLQEAAEEQVAEQYSREQQIPPPQI